MSFDKELLLKDLLKNKRIKDRVLELNLTNEECYEILPIMFDMALEEEQIDKLSYLTSFDRSSNGGFKKIDVLSTFGRSNSFMENIISLPFYLVNFETDKAFDKTDSSRKQVVNEFAKIIDKSSNNSDKKGIYLCGKSGTGKTFILKRFAKILAEKGERVAFFPVPELVNILKSTFSTGMFESKNSDLKDDLIELLKTVDYLFLDDLGAEVISNWFRDDILYLVLSERLDKNRLTFFSSIYDLKQLLIIQSRTQKERYRDNERSEKLINRIKSLANTYLLENQAN